MFSFRRNTGIFTTEEQNDLSPKDTWGFSKLFAHKNFIPPIEHHTSNSNNSLKQEHTKKFICHPENKIIHNFERETRAPIVPLPTSLVTEIVSQKEGKIHALEEKISRLQNEFQKTKMKSCRELRRMWSLSNNCIKKRKQSTSLRTKLQKTISSPNLTWGRRGQLISLLESIESTVKSANNSRENIFPRWSHRKSILQSSTRVANLTNDLEVQLWVWMERIDELEKEACNIKSDRDNMEKALERCYKESMEIEDHIMLLKAYQTKEDHETNTVFEDLKERSNLGKEGFDTCMKSKDEKIHRLMLCLEEQKTWLDKLQANYQDLKETNQTLQRDKIERNQFLCGLEASKIDLNESMKYLEKLKNEAKDYASKLASLRENFDGQVKEWKNEATELWKEILSAERTHQRSISETERLKNEIQEFESKCSVLEEEKLKLNEKLSFYEEYNSEEKKDLEMKISNLRTKLKSTKSRLTEETKSRIDLEEKLKVLNESKIKLENDLKKETEVCFAVVNELQLIKNTFEIERKKFESTREILEARCNEGKELENLRIQKLLDDLELEKKRHKECRNILEDEKKKHKLITDIESRYNQALQEKENLSRIIAENEAKIQIMEEKLTILDQELASEKLKLKSMTESFNEEVAKGEKIHKTLHDLTAETLKKERLIKSMTDDLKSKDSIESQLKSTNEELEQNIRKCETLLAQVEEEKSRSKDLTKRCEDLVDALSREKIQCVKLNEKLITVTNTFMEKINHLEEELNVKNLKIEETAEARKNLEIKIEGLTKDLKDERSSPKTEVDSIKVANVKLHEELHVALSGIEHYKMKVEEMNKTHDDEIKKLRAKVVDEQCKFKNANEKVEELQLKLGDISTNTGDENERMLNASKELAAVRENEEFIQRMYQERQKDIESLQRNLESEKFKRIQAEKDIESLNSKIEELQNIYTEEKVITKDKMKELTLKIENRELMNQDLKNEILFLKANMEDHNNQEQEKFKKLMRKEREKIQAQIKEKNLLVDEIRMLKTEVKRTEAAQIRNNEYESEIKCLKSSIKKEQSNRLKAEEENCQYENEIKCLKLSIKKEKSDRLKAEEENCQYKNEIKCLKLDIKKEQSDRLKIEEEIEKLSKEITEMRRIHVKEKLQIQQDLRHTISENEKILAEEQKKYREMEEKLMKERDELTENLKYFDTLDMLEGSYGDGRISHRSSLCDDMVESLRMDEKIKGIMDYHDRLADKICLRNLSEATSIRISAGNEILQLREELNSLKRQLLAERTSHKVTVMNLENDLQETYSLLTSMRKDKTDTNCSDKDVSMIPKNNIMDI